MRAAATPRRFEHGPPRITADRDAADASSGERGAVGRRDGQATCARRLRPVARYDAARHQPATASVAAYVLVEPKEQNAHENDYAGSMRTSTYVPRVQLECDTPVV
jgi:hypothetical protein